MLIFYKDSSVAGSVDPVVVVDYTRSDEQYSKAEILKYVAAVGMKAVKEKYINFGFLEVFALSYSMFYRHRGINYGDSLKTEFVAQIKNAPINLVNLLNVKFYTSQENIDAIKTGVNKVVDPQVFFPVGGFVIKPDADSSSVIIRTFMVYSTPYVTDDKRTSNTLTIKGAGFDAMVMRLKSAVSIKKSLPLLSQLTSIFGAMGFAITYDMPSLATMMPSVDRYYPPATVVKVLNEIAIDNKFAFDIDYDLQKISIVGFDSEPIGIDFGQILCFNGRVLGADLISKFSLQDYVSCHIESKAFDVNLYDTVTVYNDTGDDAQFENLRRAAFDPTPTIYTGYRFYVLEYTYYDDRERTTIEIRGTNNWILSVFRLDTLLEAKVFAGAAG